MLGPERLADAVQRGEQEDADADYGEGAQVGGDVVLEVGNGAVQDRAAATAAHRLRVRGRHGGKCRRRRGEELSGTAQGVGGGAVSWSMGVFVIIYCLTGVPVTIATEEAPSSAAVLGTGATATGRASNDAAGGGCTSGGTLSGTARGAGCAVAA